LWALCQQKELSSQTLVYDTDVDLSAILLLLRSDIRNGQFEFLPRDIEKEDQIAMTENVEAVSHRDWSASIHDSEAGVFSELWRGPLVVFPPLEFLMMISGKAFIPLLRVLSLVLILFSATAVCAQTPSVTISNSFSACYNSVNQNLYTHS
jgi:hypothetical protein